MEDKLQMREAMLANLPQNNNPPVEVIQGEARALLEAWLKVPMVQAIAGPVATPPIIDAIRAMLAFQSEARAGEIEDFGGPLPWEGAQPIEKHAKMWKGGIGFRSMPRSRSFNSGKSGTGGIRTPARFLPTPSPAARRLRGRMLGWSSSLQLAIAKAGWPGTRNRILRSSGGGDRAHPYPDQ